MAPGLHLATTRLALAANEVLGQSAPDPQPGQNGTGAEFGKSAPIAFVIILILFIALILLIRSMNRHVKKMPETFDEPTGTPSPEDRPLTPPRRAP